jgi:D-arginine dehydrogenase
VTELPATADVVVIGGGIAGASAACALAGQLRVVLVEAEPQAGMHSTGRSAALLTETIGNHAVRALVAASRAFLTDPPDGFSDHPLTSPRGVLYLAGVDDADTLRERASTWSQWTEVAVLDVDDARAIVPPVRDTAAALAVHEPGGLDLDVDGLLQGFVRSLRRRGGTVATGAGVTSMRRAGDGWSVSTAAGDVDCAVVVDAAGAWADRVAAMAGVEPVGLRPLRRTAFTFTDPTGGGAAGWPLVVDAGERWYLKPDAGRILGSLADETPTDPCDAKPEEADVALAVERIEGALDVEVRGVRSPWAGLRTFAPDRGPVTGPDPDAPGFVWLAGQGGYGIKTSPALADVVASHVLGTPWPAVLTERGVTPESIGPARFRTAAP